MHTWMIFKLLGFPGDSASKESDCNEEDPGSIPGSGRFPGEGNGNPLCILTWRIPWTEEPTGYSQRSLKESDKTEWQTQ